MEVILLEKVRNLGGLGDQVKVKPGFARNYLIPYGKAVVATADNKAKFEARRVELEKSQQDAFEKARARAEKLGGLTVQIERKVSEDGKLFGSVGTRDIAEAIQAMTDVEVEKSEIELSHGTLKEVGDFDVMLLLHPEVEVKIIVSVIGEK